MSTAVKSIFDEMNLYLHKTIEKTRVEGPGQRFGIWLQGCSIHCPGCMLPATWPFTRKNKMSCGRLAYQIIHTSHIEGVTILGGEAFDQSKALLCLLRNIKKHSKLGILLFTGYTTEYLQKHCPHFKAILSLIDIFIEGPYVKERRISSHPWIGSSNQTVHFLTTRYSLKDIPSPQVELRITSQGEITLNGMMPLEKLEKLFEKLS